MELTIPVNDKDHIQGKSNASVTLVEYGDFECPHCLEAYPVIKKLQEVEGSKLKFVFRNFPLSQTHEHAFRAACAAESAAKQGKFWEMHDMIFENQKNLEDQDLLSYAENLDLDTDRFKKDLGAEETAKKVKDDFMSGVRSGVNGTPTFFIDGTRFDGAYDFDLLREAVEARLR